MELIIKLQIEDGKLVNAKVKEVKKETKEVDEVSIYARFFDEGCTGWSKDPEHNLLFLKSQETYLTGRLMERGHLYLNEVYDALGIPRSKTGQVVGWIYDKKNPIGDNCVRFDIFSERNQDFVNGKTNKALLDFNVDGNILELVEDWG